MERTFAHFKSKRQRCLANLNSLPTIGNMKKVYFSSKANPKKYSKLTFVRPPLPDFKIKGLRRLLRYEDPQKIVWRSKIEEVIPILEEPKPQPIKLKQDLII